MSDDADDGEQPTHTEPTGSADDESASGERDAPLSDLAGRRRARREERESAGADADDAFEQMDVESVDSEDVWADLLDEEAQADDTETTESETDDAGTVTAVEEPAEAVGAGMADAEEPDPTAVGAAGATEAVDPREEHVIPKADYCQKCAHFSDPPDVACENEGTDIVSVEDFEHFRVRGCPVVENEFDPEDGAY